MSGFGLKLGIRSRWHGSPVASIAAPTSTFTMTQLADANRIYQRSTLTGGGQGKGQGTIPVTISAASAGTINARCRASDGVTIIQSEWQAATIAGGATTANISGVDARLGWFYLDLKDSSGSWKNGTVLVGMGALHAWAGQSLMSRMIGRADTSGTYASSGITPPTNGRVLASYNDTNVYQPTVSTMPWQQPGDGTDGTLPTSVGVGAFLNDAIATLGVNCGVIGHAHGGIWLGQYVSGQADWTQFSAVISRAGGAFEAFCWGQGHSDSSVACSAAAYQAQLDILYAQVAGINSFSGFKTYVWTIPAVTSNTLGTSWQYTQVRLGAKNWCAANGATYVHAYDFDVPGGVHEANTASSAAWLGRTMFRATRADYGLSSGIGPALVSATRTGTTITLTLSDVGQTNLVLTGSTKDLFFVFPTGKSNNKDVAINDNRFPVSTVTVTNKTTLTLTLANDPGDANVLDLWLNYGIVGVDPGANYICDDRTDDGLPRGRNVQANFTPISIAAPNAGGTTNAPPVVAAAVSTHTMTGTSMTYGAGASGFGTRRTGGTASTGAQSLPAYTFECFITAPTAGAQLVIANGLPGQDWFGIDSTNHLNSSSGASGATALVAGKLYHVAFVRGPTGMRIYQKNITDALASVRDYNSTTPFGTAWSGGPAPNLQLGHLNSSFVFTGNIDEAALFYGERYTGTTHTPPAAPYVGNETNLMLLWHLDSNLTEVVQH